MENNINIEDYLPIYKKLSPNEQNLIKSTMFTRTVPKGTIVHNGNNECLGLTIVKSGQLRAYMYSPDGREITLFRLLQHDISLFSATCTMQSLQFDISIVTEKDSEIIIIPTNTYVQLSATSLALVTYANELMATHFTDIMWLFEQIMWHSFDKRLAAFLIEESSLENSSTLSITHEIIANHLGTAREVVTRMLKYFQTENYIKLSRGTIEIINFNGLQSISR